MLLCLGCAGQDRQVEFDGDNGGQLDPAAPSYVEIATKHNARVVPLATIYSRGVIEIRWTDDRGKHFEQGDLRLWLQLPEATSIRVEKLGDVLLWLGSQGDAYWMFDLLGEETVLYQAMHGEVGTGGPFPVEPLALVDLVGLTPLPVGDDTPAKAPAVIYDRDRDAWLIESIGLGGPVRLYFQRENLQLFHVDHQAADGRLMATSSLRRFRSVNQAGSLSVNWPRMPTLIDVDLAEGGDSLRIALDGPTGLVDDQPLDRVFDLERLIKALRPDRVEVPVPPADAGAPSAPD